jgi:hypothetical protein
VAKDVLAGVFATLMEAIHVELAYEGVYISMSEILRQDVVLKLIYLFDGKLTPVCHPVDY